MKVILELIQGPQKGDVYVFDHHDMFIVGRSSEVHCSVPADIAMSRDHFLIEVNPPQCYLHDLNSTNGTFINGRPMKEAALGHGDLIAAGQSVFRVVLDQPRRLAHEPIRDPSGETATAVAAGPQATQVKCVSCGQMFPIGMLPPVEHEGLHYICDACKAELRLRPQPVPGYQIVRKLGEGGMGVVYLAEQVAAGRPVAIKLIIPQAATTRKAIELFMREVEVISRLKHLNIVEFYEHGTAEGQCWFAMEYVQGTNVEKMAKQFHGRVGIAVACGVMSHVLRGLAYAHRQGFVHRDVKPENILIGRHGAQVHAKLSDFGLAKSYTHVGLGSGLTLTGEIRGSVPFMPPEQLRNYRTVSPQADLYAVGASLYYLLTGQNIYDQPEDSSDFLRVVLEDRPVPIEDRRPDIPPPLALVIDRSLARDPLARFQTAEEFRAALRPFCQTAEPTR